MHAPMPRKRVEMSCQPGVHDRALASSSHYDNALVWLSRHTRVGVATLGLLTKRSLGPCTTTTFFRNLGPWAALRHHVVGKALPLCLEC